ncbi:GGDEF domain-containing protein [Alcaligenaceae bacterium]|nr:GGDEF domain-containing protein [Alcaligenaceae bacterium]
MSRANRRSFLRYIRYGWMALSLGILAVPTSPALACDGAQYIRLHTPVQLSAQELAEFRALPPLRVVSVDAPPMTHYSKDQHTYTGISVDVLCFIAKELGLRYELIPGRNHTVGEKIQQVQDGQADIFIPLSRSPERNRHGVFTIPYYESHYAAITRKGRQLPIYSATDLAQYRVGIVGGVSLEPILKEIIPLNQLIIYDKLLTSDALFQALRNDDIDVAVFNKNIFIEKRYKHDLFDLEPTYTLHEYPRAYRFYLSHTPQHQRIAAAFDRYLAAIDSSASIARHENGERQLIERYVAQRSQRVLLQAASVAITLLALIFYLVLRRYRRLARQLADGNQQISQQKRALQQAYQELEKLSQTDSLTGLANRGHFDQTLVRELARRQRRWSPLSLLIIDLDHFKLVNDHYGHAVGDRYLRAIASVLENSVSRPADLAARYGGEEFACLLPDTNAQNARVVADRIRQAVARLDLPNALADRPRLTLCIGIATLMDSTDFSAQELLAQADSQLYAAKHAGRDRIQATVLGKHTRGLTISAQQETMP